MNQTLFALGGLLAGIIGTLVGVIATGFLREAGKDLYGVVKERFNPPPPEDVFVDVWFDAPKDVQGRCVWANEDSVYRKKDDGYVFYPHPSNGGRCYRKSGDIKSFLMIKPDS